MVSRGREISEILWSFGSKLATIMASVRLGSLSSASLSPSSMPSSSTLMRWFSFSSFSIAGSAATTFFSGALMMFVYTHTEPQKTEVSSTASMISSRNSRPQRILRRLDG